MKLLYLGCLCSDKIFNQIIEQGFLLSQAAYKLERQLISHFIDDNLIAKGDVTVLSSLPCGDNEIKVNEEYVGNVKIEYIWNNRNETSDLLRSWKMVRRKICDWEKRTRNEDRIVLTYATDMVLLFPMLLCKYFHKDIKVVTICSEIPQFRNYSYTSNLKGFVFKTIYTFLNESMDGYIFLSKYMNEVCNRKNRPWIVVEGLPEIHEIQDVEEVSCEEEPRIVYAGGFDCGYGIEELLEAMSHVKHKSAQLLICGNGDLLERIQQYERQNNNIHYLGVLPNNEVMQIEAKAAVLINPRKPDLMLTRYSFPSKTLEYFANGHAVSLITKLDGIPKEYYDYCFVLQKVTPEEIAEKIDSILDMPKEYRIAVARKAYEFVKNEKSAKAQSKKVFEFVKLRSKNGN
ncbi:MAG: glycosyltransferase [Tyzzerella sp.]|nr:glycosyltransferase [Tyzzerella sp.]